MARRFWMAVAVLVVGVSGAEPLKILAVGNSFSVNALRYFEEIVKAAGDQVVVGHAMIGGCDFERHVRHADAFEKNPDDPEGRPYMGKKRSLQEMLRAEAWQYVTIQQVSHKAPLPESYQPAADQLIAYIRKYAPQAEIVVHQTWAYRDDYPVGSKGFVSTEDMYRRVSAAYRAFCAEKGLRMIPSGDAMEAARHAPEWGKFEPDKEFDPATARHPQLPQNERRSLHGGYRWRKDAKSGKYILGWDKFHANATGEYLLGCVWYEFFFKRSVVGNSFKPENVGAAEVQALQRVAGRVNEDS